MKKSVMIGAVLFCFTFLSGSSLLAQPAQGNVIILNNAELSLSSEGTIAEFDSLTNLYNTKVLDKNELVISYKVFRHWWGHNNRDFITLMEVKSWADVIAANQRNTELFQEAWSTPEARKEYNAAYNKYFTGEHSDEIYTEVD
jgi:histone deacetylase complex regulatory component SIN3